jgi:DNA-binding transcriptional MerR regulator
MTDLKPRKLTLGRLAREAGLARASLLNYERMGLLRPGGRSAAGYRWYGTPEIDRLHLIRRLRAAGLSLPHIRDLLKARASGAKETPQSLLEGRLLELCDEVERLRTQQALLARLLASPEFRGQRQLPDKAGWVSLLRRAGLNDAQMHAWHAGFETDSPAEHAGFLRKLGLTVAEVEGIRHWSRLPLATTGIAADQRKP